MTPLMRKVLLFAGIGWLFDAMDQGMVSGVIASIGSSWTLSTVELSMLGSAGTLGMILGAALSGIMSDRWGRRSVIIFTLLLFSVGSFLSGLAVSYVMLLATRFITGFGLGGELPAASTLVSEFSPVAKRGRNVVILESFWAWGWIAAALVASLAIPTWGWRAAFFIGAVPALFAAVLRFAIPESPRYLAARGRLEEAEKLVAQMEREAGAKSAAGSAGGSTADGSVAGSTAVGAADGAAASAAGSTADGAATTQASTATVATPQPMAFARLWQRQHLRATAVLWVIWFGINFGYYGFVLWTPTFLVTHGFDLVRSFTFTLIMCFAQLPGYLAAALLIERLGRKPVLVVFMLGTALSAWLFGHASSEMQVLIFGCMLYFFALGAWGCVYSYTPELYPTAIRGAGVGWAAAFGRVGAFIAPFIVPALYALFGSESGFVAVFIVLTVVFAVVALVVGILGIETKGRPLD